MASYGKYALVGVGITSAIAILRYLGNVKFKTKGITRDHPCIQYCNAHSVRPNPVLDKLQQFTTSLFGYRMMGAIESLQLLANLAKAIGARKTLDIGVYTGSSALAIAQILPENGKVVACDVSEEFTNYAKPYWNEAGVSDKIDLQIGPAVETLESLVRSGESGTFDFAFIDADKPNYDNYYELCLKLLRSGGIIVIDNTLWGGKVADPSIKDTATVAIRTLNDKVHKDDRVDCNQLFLGDGTTLVFKR